MNEATIVGNALEWIRTYGSDSSAIVNITKLGLDIGPAPNFLVELKLPEEPNGESAILPIRAVDTGPDSTWQHITVLQWHKKTILNISTKMTEEQVLNTISLELQKELLRLEEKLSRRQRHNPAVVRPAPIRQKERYHFTDAATRMSH